MVMLKEEVIKQSRDVLKKMRDPLALTYFSQEVECGSCASMSSFVDELDRLDDRLHISRKEFVRDRDLAFEIGVHHIPAHVVHHPGDGRAAVRYYGLPGGYEFGAFLRTLVLFSSGEKADDSFDPATVAAIEKEINLKVFVLTTCPSCPVMAYLGSAMAHANPKITVEIIEANTFVDLSTRFTVGSVPKIVVNDTVEVAGVLPPGELVRKITAL
jgi:glutaredoxin-like protein